MTAPYVMNAAALPNQTTCCVRPTAPTPRIFPASRMSGFTLAMMTSATRVIFSSSTPRMTFWPYSMIIMYSMNATMKPKMKPTIPLSPRPRSSRRSAARFDLHA